MNVTLENYTKIIKGTTILDNINLTMNAGKIYGIRGVNGSGKTMLMRAICGLILPTSGRAIVNGKIIGKDISFPEQTGVLIENPDFLTSYTGFKNLQLLASIQGLIDDNSIRETLIEVGLEPEDKRKYKKYSLGMKQRLGIAAAIMENPNLLILDEPLNALDTEGIERVRKIIRKFRTKERVILLACHDKSEMELLADTIYFIENGKIIGDYTV